MLRKETVSESTLELLNTLMNDELLKDFFLVGGTALSLQIGHRISIDLDLFTMVSFYDNQILSDLEDKYKFQLDYQSKNTLKGEIDGVAFPDELVGYKKFIPATLISNPIYIDFKGS